ncbi:MAG: hypothetical protein FJX74_07100 [Armatimonadetes bacterium]|nr:hypothetical protein [Armatimonadota bacterium]
MSEAPAIGIVCEGDTDEIVLRAILSVVAGEHRARLVQPERTRFAGGGYGVYGGGWKGVREWCRAQGRLSEALASAPLSRFAALIMHLDAEVAGEREVGCEQPCPPASASVEALRAFVLCEWCGEDTLPPRAVFCIPSKSTEAWVFVGLYPEDKHATPDVECRPKPETLLKQRPDELVSGAENRKNTAAFREVAPRVAAAWPRVCEVCTQAARFDRDLRAVLR